MANDWRLIGLILALVLIWAVGVAIWTRWSAKAKLQGQTIWHVAAGVAGVVVAAGFRIGFEDAAFLLVCFFVAALPMAVEYFGRLQREEMEAQKVLEESYEHAGPDRKE
ncbi:MAG: hypothetical protein EHM40_03360 [Chloroflexi bacterium]|nr:MAG: hypothetical protein EHM40_03360 [Chloroflexota bacterium]